MPSIPDELHDQKAPTSEQADTWWEAVARSAWGSYVTRIEKEVLLAAVELAGPPQTALEVGCEGGRWSAMLRDLGWRNICTDIVPESIERCRRRLPDANCILVSERDERLPAADGSIGLLLLYEVPPVTEAAWFPAEARRVLHPDGVLVFAHLNSHSYRGLIYRIARKVQRLWGGCRRSYYYNGPSYGCLRQSLVQLGFEFVREEGICWFPFRRMSDSPLVAPAVRLESLLGLRKLATISPWVVSVARLRSGLP